ncbi:hypothetical protein ZWY2020_037418 [Hordeum vulgare]|nr:hypothetical protein ZWY2020_037418 [Hordeum vulgare]
MERPGGDADARARARAGPRPHRAARSPPPSEPVKGERAWERDGRPEEEKALGSARTVAPRASRQPQQWEERRSRRRTRTARRREREREGESNKRS